MALDLNLLPLYRIDGQEAAGMPGLLALMPPRTGARGREQDRLLAYLLLTGNSTFTTAEYKQVAEDASKVFYSTAGSITSALRAAGEAVNKTLLDRNMSTSSRGQYAVGWLTLGAVRESQCTFLLSGPMHIYHYGRNESRHIFEPQVSGKGLGMSQAAGIHYAQVALQPGDWLLMCGKIPRGWESALADPTPSSPDAMRRRLTTLTNEDLNAVLMKVKEGSGRVTLLNGTADLREEKAEEPARPPASPGLPRRTEGASQPAENISAHVVQPSAYAIPPQAERTRLESARPGGGRDFPASIPRAGSQARLSMTNEPMVPPEEGAVGEQPQKTEPPREPSRRARRAAKTLVNVIQTSRRVGGIVGGKLKNFLPRLLPNNDAGEPLAPSNALMVFIAVLIPLIVVTMLSVVYLRYGRSLQYETHLRQAQQKRTQAAALTDPVEQRKAWENVLLNVDIAESHRQTPETNSLRREAEENLDGLLGITRVQFGPALSSSLGIEISRMAASETDLFMLNAADGEVLRAQLSANRGFQLDGTFNCRPGSYGNYTVGPLVDILTMPTLNSINATLLGVDAGGNLLYCAPGQVAQAIPLPVPDTNWGRVTAFVLDGGNLYVMDAPARAVWVYNGKDGAFIDRPYFFFGQQTPTQDVIDLVVSGDELYLLHSDGRLSNCSYSRIEAKPSQCRDPFPMTNPFSAYQDLDLFGTAHFTQILLAAQPDQSILLLDADTQGVMRFSPRTLELTEQFRPDTGPSNPIPPGPVGAVTVGPNHVLYLAVDGQVYFAVIP